MNALKTKNYDIFKFRDDNRAKIEQAHVKRLESSIKSKNLLEMRPISVNKDMEIIDGQHRLLAAKNLGVEVYYQVEESLDHHDIILMNISKAWRSMDYLNYYCKNGYPEYIKLRDFMKENDVTLKIALNMSIGSGIKDKEKFKSGEYVFSSDAGRENLQDCWDTIIYIKRMNGYSSYTSSARFWKALIKLVQHALFDKDKWMKNLIQMIERVGPRARTDDYLRQFMEIYNWKNTLKLNLLDE